MSKLYRAGSARVLCGSKPEFDALHRYEEDNHENFTDRREWFIGSALIPELLTAVIR